MYWLKENIELNFGDEDLKNIAENIGITNSYLSKIKNRRVGCSKPIANSIAMQLEFVLKARYSPRKISKYFDYKED